MNELKKLKGEVSDLYEIVNDQIIIEVVVDLKDWKPELLARGDHVALMWECEKK